MLFDTQQVDSKADRKTFIYDHTSKIHYLCIVHYSKNNTYIINPVIIVMQFPVLRYDVRSIINLRCTFVYQLQRF